MHSLKIEFTTEPKYITLYKELKKLIQNGYLKPNEKIPSKRILSKNLSISINTVISAYDLLLSEGYISSKEKSGYYVNDFFYTTKLKSKIDIQSQQQKIYRYNFTSEEVEKNTFPSYTFKKITSNILINNSDIFLTKSPCNGDYNLRVTISRFLHENKGIEVIPDQIIIVSSLEESLNIVHSLINIRTIAVENPGYFKIKKYLDSSVRFEYLDLDQDGIKINENSYSLVYVTPYNQFPTGIKMSLKRKHEIIKSPSQYIFEDDFDCDLIDNNQHVSTLFSINQNKVFLHNSFSHTLCPGIRISYLIIPKILIKKYLLKYQNNSSKISSLDQSIINEFILGGYYYRHINKIKRINQRKKLIINEFLSKKAYIDYQVNDLSYLISIKNNIDYDKLKKHLEDALIKIRFIEDYSFNIQDKRLILSYSSIDESNLIEGLKELFFIIESLF